MYVLYAYAHTNNYLCTYVRIYTYMNLATVTPYPARPPIEDALLHVNVLDCVGFLVEPGLQVDQKSGVSVYAAVDPNTCPIHTEE